MGCLVGLQSGAAAYAGDRVTAHPDLAAGVLADVDAAFALDAGALVHHVAGGHVVVRNQPLGQAGVQAAGDRVFVDAVECGKGAHFQALQCLRIDDIVRCKERGCAKIAQQRVALRIAQNIMAVQIPMQYPAGMQMAHRRSNAGCNAWLMPVNLHYAHS